MKKLKHFLLYLRIWLIRKMGYRIPSIRQAPYIVPGQLYDHFAYIIRTKPRAKSYVQPDGEGIPEEKMAEYCRHCDLYDKNIPCNFTHKMLNGEEVCTYHQFEIICLNPD